MRLLVTGITGFIGSYLAEEVKQRGNIDLTVVVRPSNLKRIEYLKNLGLPDIRVVPSNILDPYIVRLPYNEYDAVINLVGPRSNNTDVLWQANVEYVRRLAMLLKNINVGRVVHMSSIGVYGLPKGSPTITEEHVLAPTDWYGSTKLMGEQIWQDFYRRTGVPVRMLRASWVIGHGSHLLDKYLFTAFGHGIRLVMPLATPVNAIYARDVADACLKAALASGDGAKSYNINLAERIAFRDFLKIINVELKGLKFPLIIPKIALRVLSRKITFFRGLLNDAYYDPTKVKDELGFTPRYDLAAMVREISTSYGT